MRFATQGGRLVAAGTLLAALALPFASLGALRLRPPLPLVAGSDGGWLAAAGAATVAMAAAAAALATLVVALRSGRVGGILAAAGAALLAGGFASMALGAQVAASATAASAVVWVFAAAAERAELRADGRASRVSAALAFAGVEAVLITLLLAGTRLAPLHAPLLALSAAAYGLSALMAAGRWPPAGTLLLGAGAATWALARPGSLDLLVAEATLTAGAIALGAGAAAVRDAAPGPGLLGDADDALPQLARRLADGAFLFDDRRRLRDWNAGGAELLRIGPGAAGTPLQDLLGNSIAGLEAEGGWAAVVPPGTGDPLEVALVPHDSGMIVLARDPAGPPTVREQTERLERELRGTIEELMHARRTIELQRAELERAATVDPLTGVASRGAVLERLRVEVAEARRYAHSVAVTLIDVDGLAVVNHQHGLDVGDAVLREVALRIRLRVRQADALGRSAGDAFLAILPHTDEGGAASFADALRRRLAQRPAATSAGPIPVTVSVGVAVLRPGETLDVDGLLARVEEALASAQAAGGDRIALDRLHGLARLEMPRREASRRPSVRDETTQGSGT